jgi:DNA-binding NarL/FixJ family response regulator
MDIAMPLLNGLEATRQILHAQPGAKILMLSAHSDDAYVKKTPSRSARSGFLLKQSSAHDVCRALREVHAGRTFFTPSLAKRLNHHQKKSRERGELSPGIRKKKLSHVFRPTALEHIIIELKAAGFTNCEITDPVLSSRETEVIAKVRFGTDAFQTLQLIAEGKANKETADELHISVKTVVKKTPSEPHGQAQHPRHRRPHPPRHRHRRHREQRADHHHRLVAEG